VAQSPVEAIAPEDAKDYMASWDALSSMIGRGRSFSGRERHCAFLNTRGKAFANVSASTGLDLIDDGRGLGVTDWDGDGDLDLWMTHRTGPRVRFLRNDVPGNHSFVALQLHGTTCNRDAIGARVTATTSSGRQLVRMVRAGDSFLSQSSKTVHIGLLPDETVDGLTVLWPGNSEPEGFAIPETGHRYALEQSASSATKLESPVDRGSKLTPSEPHAAPSTEKMRIVLSSRRPAPTFNYVGFDGTLQKFERQDQSGPVLINLWASWCGPCVVELNEFSEAHETIAAKKLKILALSTDPITEDGSKPDVTKAKALVADAQFPFDIGAVDANVVRLLTVVHNSAIARERPLPLPSSFLIDKNGNVAVIYKGPVSVTQLLADVDLLDAAPRVVEAATFPFPGKDGLNLFKLTPLAFAQAYQDGGYIDDARRYIEEHFQFEPSDGTTKPSRALVQAQYFLGTLAQSESNWDGAAVAYQKVLEMSPSGTTIHVPLAVVLWQAGRKDEASEHFSIAAEAAKKNRSLFLVLGRAWLQINQPIEALPFFEQAEKLNPDSSQTALLVASALARAGRSAEGVAKLEEFLGKDPGAYDISNHLAWTYATDTDPKVRNGNRALQLAQSLAEQSGRQNPRVLDTLAAAYANAGDFVQAEQIARQARDLAHARGISALAQSLSTRMASYQSREPWRSE
jgi:tetratricopeptide (TPR) repeat protein/peroxiredoxin